MGEIQFTRSDKQQSADLRVAADQEMEGDERCHTSTQWIDPPTSPIDLRHGGYARTWGFLPDVYGPNADYHYVGGLERLDNHAQDGVNVLHYDWHAGFDGRSWPSPIGMVRKENGNWQKYQWDASQTSLPDWCPAEENSNNAIKVQ
jgi:hypothetical protein